MSAKIVDAAIKVMNGEPAPGTLFVAPVQKETLKAEDDTIVTFNLEDMPKGHF